jgi:uncharacterized protein (DUF2342 family)
VGLEAKLRQYEAGERFIAEIEAEAGPLAVRGAWTEPAALPTLAEIHAPTLWLERVGGLISSH